MGRAGPVDPIDLTKLLDDDARPRPPGKPLPAKKQIGYDVEHRGKREAKTLLENLHSEFKLKREAVQSSYEMMKQKELAIMECKELKFLSINTDGFLETEAALTNRKKEAILKKYV
ncbi:hypothetical protein Tco_0787843 [Tanacetum coccineum]